MNTIAFLRCSLVPVSRIGLSRSAGFDLNTFKYVRRTFASSIIQNVNRNKFTCRNHVLSSLGSNRTLISVSKFSSAPPDINLMKKRPNKKRYAAEIDPENMEEGTFIVCAFATAKEYDLECLKTALDTENLYETLKIADQEVNNVLTVMAKYKVGSEPRHIFFFREGSVVFWNCSDLEASNVLGFLKNFEDESYSEKVITREKEVMAYKYQLPGKKCQLQGSTFVLSQDSENLLEKYTFSNAMSQSVKLGIWENVLDRYADSLADVTEVLEKGNPIKMTRAEVLRKAGALFALRHHINLDSDLLDIPDFYWERAALEKLYNDTVIYFSLTRRTKVLNEKLSHCAELVELVGAQLSDRHHVRLEWMIIVLIMVEVVFEVLHFTERYWHTIE